MQNWKIYHKLLHLPCVLGESVDQRLRIATAALPEDHHVLCMAL